MNHLLDSDRQRETLRVMDEAISLALGPFEIKLACFACDKPLDDGDVKCLCEGCEETFCEDCVEESPVNRCDYCGPCTRDAAAREETHRTLRRPD